MLRNGVRHAVFGLTAAGVTFGIGRLVGIGLGLPT
jgi:VIT1/CCC1 family predicted Fe2+/Mn2+ transporter